MKSFFTLQLKLTPSSLLIKCCSAPLAADRENEEIRAGETGANLGTYERHLCVSTTELEITPSLSLLWFSDI